jgi:peptidyl-prolyl cis-trans isomerase D
MFDEVRKPGRAKSIIAYILFGAIILVFALFGISPDRFGGSAGGGTAAVVNETTISVAEFRQRLDMVERNAKAQLDQMPPEQRDMIRKSLMQRTLEQMIMGEVIYQNASQKGILAPDSEIRDYLFNVPIFQDQGRFVREKYVQFLQGSGQTSDAFEGLIRKEIVTRKMQEIFATAMTPANAEIDQLLDLRSKSVNLRFMNISPSALSVEKGVTDADVAAYVGDKAHADAIKKYYNEHALDYDMAERVRAKHILIGADPKNPKDDGLAKAKEIKAKVTKENFSAMASKESKDTMSAKKGGDLGFFEKGKMVPAFEQAAFAMKPGEISEPIKSDFGYHIIYVTEHEPARKVSVDEAKPAIAKKLIAQERTPEAVDSLKKAAESGSVNVVETAAKKYGLTWEKAENVNLGSPQIAKIQDPQEVLTAVVAQSGKAGLIPKVIGARDAQYIVDVVAWKKADKIPSRTELQNNIAYQKASGDAFEDWVKTAEEKSSISRNQRLFSNQ